MINRRIDEIDQAAIQELVDGQVAEGRTLEYKQQLPGRTDSEKKEFLADVSSFANTSGGDIVYGMVERRDSDGRPTDLPEEARGLADLNLAAERQRLESIVRAGVEPRIPGVRMVQVDGFPDGPALVIRIPRSWITPHMVKFGGTSRFYARNSGGKYQMDVTEIRSSFLRSEEVPKRIREFRDERLGRLLSGESPVSKLHAGPLLVTHTVPVEAIASVQRIDVLDNVPSPSELRPPGASGWDHRYNLDGFLTHNTSAMQPDATAYLQVFRDGRIEAVRVLDHHDLDDGRYIFAGNITRLILEMAGRSLRVVNSLGLSAPIVVLVSMIGVGGCRVLTSRRGHSAPHALDRDTIVFPDASSNDLAVAPSELLRQVLDLFFQAAGWPQCIYFDAEGVYTQPED